VNEYTAPYVAVPAQYAAAILALAAFVSMVAGEDTAPAQKVEEGGQVEDKAEHKAEVEEGQLQDGVAEGGEDGEALLEEAEEDEEGDEEDEEDDMEDGEESLLEEEEDEEDEDDEEDEEDPEDPKEVMQELDADKDGLLDLAELTNQDSQEEMDENSREQNGFKIKEVFETFDKNKDILAHYVNSEWRRTFALDYE